MRKDRKLPKMPCAALLREWKVVRNL